MVLVAAFTVFLVSLLIGAVGIYIAASIITDKKDYFYAVGTAFVGAIVGAVVGLIIGWIPLIGPVATLIAWIAVINWRYPGGWIDAGLIGFAAWIATVVVLVVLAALGLPGMEATGVPGT